MLECPIISIDLPSVPDIELKGLIVLTGSNSSGKTQTINDINELILGKKRQLVIVSGVKFRLPPPFEELFNYLLRKELIIESDGGKYSKRDFHLGMDEGGGSFVKSALAAHDGYMRSICKAKVTGTIPANPYLAEIGHLTCSTLFLKNRLTLMDKCPALNPKTENPKKTLQALYLSKRAKAAFLKEMSAVFRRAAWPDPTRVRELVLRVSDNPDLPSAEDRTEYEVMERYRTIESEGDGLRSYAAICATLILGERPLCLIDEPEMCLHPPHAYAMGRFIGANTSDNRCTIVATHSSHVLRGILETNPRAQVIRLSRNTAQFSARRLDADSLQSATSKPRSRSEAILEGLLSHCVVMCEAEGDRMVYESAYRTWKSRPLDIRFVAAEGTGGFADALRLYRLLGVCAAVIADIDFLSKEGELKRVLVELACEPPEVERLLRRAREMVATIRTHATPIDHRKIAEELGALAEKLCQDSTEPASMRRKLHELSEQLHSLRDLKKIGVSALPDQPSGSSEIALRQQLLELMDELAKAGLFLVPVGELESWVSTIMKGHSRDDKSQWAMLAAEKIEEVGPREGDVWQFVQSICRHLERRTAAGG